jgi:hypothetical protein
LRCTRPASRARALGKCGAIWIQLERRTRRQAAHFVGRHPDGTRIGAVETEDLLLVFRVRHENDEAPGERRLRATKPSGAALVIDAVCPGLIDTALSRPWFEDMSKA